MNIDKALNFVQASSPDGGFLQSDEWRKFQESVGRRTFLVSDEGFYASIIEHKLPIVGKYFYIPRGPIIKVESSKKQVASSIEELIKLAKKEDVGWIRIDTDYKNDKYKIIKAPHDMQPRELFIIDITKPEDQLLAEMKSKTRYNIKLAQKHGVKVSSNNEYIGKFIELIKITAKRDKITPHPDEYYRKMFETIPPENIRLYIAEYKNKTIVANIVVFYGKAAIYLHGASDHNYKNLMAPYLLQWQVILDAKKMGYNRYDFGGVKTKGHDSWAGITRFKTGFSSVTQPIQFPGSYDIVLSPLKYNPYRILQQIKALF